MEGWNSEALQEIYGFVDSFGWNGNPLFAFLAPVEFQDYSPMSLFAEYFPFPPPDTNGAAYGEGMGVGQTAQIAVSAARIGSSAYKANMMGKLNKGPKVNANKMPGSKFSNSSKMTKVAKATKSGCFIPGTMITALTDTLPVEEVDGQRGVWIFDETALEQARVIELAFAANAVAMLDGRQVTAATEVHVFDRDLNDAGLRRLAAVQPGEFLVANGVVYEVLANEDRTTMTVMDTGFRCAE